MCYCRKTTNRKYMNNENTQSAAWHEGYKGYTALFPKKNPYPKGTLQHADWVAGFNDAVGERAW